MEFDLGMYVLCIYQDLSLVFSLLISYATGIRPAGITHIHCHGNETHLLQCSHRNDSNNHCEKFDQIGLQCSEWCSEWYSEWCEWYSEWCSEWFSEWYTVSGVVSGSVSGIQ